MWLQPGEPMLFAGGTKGLTLDRERLTLKVVEGGDDRRRDRPRPDQPRRRAHADRDAAGAFPMALGVIYDDPAPTFESAVVEQNAAAASGKTPDLQALVAKGQTWQVEKEPHEL